VTAARPRTAREMAAAKDVESPSLGVVILVVVTVVVGELEVVVLGVVPELGVAVGLPGTDGTVYLFTKVLVALPS
jgi:hypothetical protein